MIRWILCIAVICWPGFLFAQGYKVRSGEHADFSRLVLRFPDMPTWRFGRVDGGYELHFDQGETRLDLSDVYRLMPRTRIQDITQPEAGRLALSVTCACHADVFALENGRLVIDIKDGAPQQTAVFDQSLSEMPASATAPERGGAAQSDPDTVLNLLEFGQPLAPEEPAEQPIELVFDLVENQAQPVASPVDLNRFSPAEYKPSQSDLAWEYLLRQLQRGASQGVVNGTSDLPQGRAEMTADPQGDHPKLQIPDDAHIRVETVIDRDAPDPQALSSRQASRPQCPDQDIWIKTWGDPTNVSSPYEDLRSQLVGEFDEVDIVVLEQLVQRNLYFGFGAEARALLLSYPGVLDLESIYIEIAKIVDGEQKDGDQQLAELAVCAGDLVVLALLAHRGALPGDVDKNRILQSVAGFPPHLRRHLGPDLAERFLAADDLDMATEIKNLIDRGNTVEDAPLVVLDADIVAGAGDTTQSIDQWMDVVDQNLPGTPSALARLIETQLQGGVPVRPKDIQLAEALAVEHRDTELGQRLWLAAIRGTSSLGLIKESLDRIAEAAQNAHIPPKLVSDIRIETLQSNAELADDKTFLNVVYATDLPPSSQSKMTRNVRVLTAERLLSLGFADRAYGLITDQVRSGDAEMRVLLAKIYMALDAPKLAEQQLLNLDSQGAKATLAEIYARAGNYDLAASVDAVGRDEAALQSAAWRSGNWAEVIALQSAQFSKGARIAMQTELPANGTDPVGDDRNLELGKQVLQKSIEQRADIEDLLVQSE